MSAITTHILDTHLGVPASGVPIQLFRQIDHDTDGIPKFQELACGVTDDDGRNRSLLPEGEIQAGIYQMRFEINTYHRRNNIESFYPEVRISFIVRDGTEHYHVPLLISPFGYSTYRGS